MSQPHRQVLYRPLVTWATLCPCITMKLAEGIFRPRQGMTLWTLWTMSTFVSCARICWPFLRTISVGCIC